MNFGPRPSSRFRKKKKFGICLNFFQVRDVGIAYILVIVTYLVVGVTFYISFPLPKACIADVSFSEFLLLSVSLVPIDINFHYRTFWTTSTSKMV